MVRSETVMHSDSTTYSISPRTHRSPYARRLWVLLPLLALVCGGPLPVRAANLAQSAGDPLVMAFYYTWFDQNTWTYDTLSDLPAEPYVSADRAVMGIGEGMVRISVGVEHPEDIINDIEQALEKVQVEVSHYA